MEENKKVEVKDEIKTTDEAIMAEEENKEKEPFNVWIRHTWVWRNRGKAGAALGAICTCVVMAILGGHGDDGNGNGADNDSTDNDIGRND